MTTPWVGAGAWAADAEREEQEALENAAVQGGGGGAASADSQSFPSLREAASAKPKKKKMTLSEFNMSTSVGGGRLTHDEMLQLPTGPKQRSAEEMQHGRLGGGFSNYGSYGGGRSSGAPPPHRMRDETDGGGSWGRRPYGGGGGFDEDRRGPPRVSDFDQQPSRADEVDNWASGKKQLPSYDAPGGRQNRYGSLGGGSRADDVTDWTSGKKPIPPPVRSSAFGSGFRSNEPDRWTRGEGGGGGGGLEWDRERERPRLVLDPPKGDSGGDSGEVVKINRPNPFGAARPREEVLAEKGLDWKKLDSDFEAKKVIATTSRPTSAQSSRPSSAQSSRSEQGGGLENAVRPRSRVNPFGDAKPREVLLQERGQDWRKIDLELDHRRVDRSVLVRISN